MKIKIIDNIVDFEKIKCPWNEVFANDPSSTIFSSWAWFRGWVYGTPNKWRILALTPEHSTDCIAFFPVGFTTRKKMGIKFSEIYIGGNPNSDHAGFVCLPGYWDEVCFALVEYLKNKVAWDIFYLRDVFDEKIDQFVDFFPMNKFKVQRSEGQVCPYIPLPESWDNYLKDFLGKKNRQKFRRYIRELDESEDYKIEIANNENFDDYLSIYVNLYRQRWPQVSNKSIEMKKMIMRNCFEADSLLLATLLFKNDPLATRVDFIDRKCHTISAYNSAWDQKKDPKLSPGTRLRVFLVRYAIENNFKYLDFLRGGEEYKQKSFGAINRYNKDILIFKKNLKNLLENIIRLH